MSIPEGEDLDQLRTYLLRYATLQLRDAALAEDVVQETLLAALNARSGFSGKSAYKTWLVGILRHKIVDAARKQSRERGLAASEEIAESDPTEELFDADGSWRQIPAAWGDPEKSFENGRFWETLERCLEQLPARTARAFMMREVMDATSDDVCKDLAIAPTNLWVMLHRARLGLRECLNSNWFAGAAK